MIFACLITIIVCIKKINVNLFDTSILGKFLLGFSENPVNLVQCSCQ